MESTVILSPPISRVIEARSSVAVTTFRRDAAGASPAAAMKRSAADPQTLNRFFKATSPSLPGTAQRRPGFVKLVPTSERVCAVRPHRKDELEQELVGGSAFPVVRPAKLAADLAELARPVGQEQ